jgi:hypothetical protein
MRLHLFAVPGMALLTACSTASSPPTADPTIPPAAFFDVKVQPTQIPPNPVGGFRLSSETGCDVIYIARAAAVDTVTFAMRPTSRVPDAADCAARLKEQTGVVSVAALP